MKSALVAILLISLACIKPESDHVTLFKQVHEYYNSGQLTKVNELLADDFKLIRSDSSTTGKKDYMRFLSDWNDPLHVKWIVLSYKENGGKIISYEQDTCYFYNYACDSAMTVKYEYSFENGKIKSIYVFPYDNKKCEERQTYLMNGFFSWLRIYSPSTFPILNDRGVAEAIDTYFPVFVKETQE